MLWTLLFEAVQAVNVLDTHDLTDFYFSDRNNKMYQFQEPGFLTLVRNKDLIFILAFFTSIWPHLSVISSFNKIIWSIYSVMSVEKFAVIEILELVLNSIY